MTPLTPAGPGRLLVELAGPPDRLLSLRLAQSVAYCYPLAATRPRALLGDQVLRELVRIVAAIRRLSPPGAFTTLHVSAAGSDSTVLQRVRRTLAEATGLIDDPADGDLLLRLRRATAPESGWEVLLRLTPRPLATRPWRHCHWPGALNATVAAAMIQLTEPHAGDRVLNLGCGSGTLLIERLLAGPAALAVGCDTDPAALACARTNLAAAGLSHQVALTDWDVTALPASAGAYSVLVADLPYGHRVGSHEANMRLYPALLAEAARVAEPGARCVLITPERRLLARALEGCPDWRLERELRLAWEHINPTVSLLRRR